MDAPVLTVLPNLVIINGIGRYTWSAGAPKIRISIPRTFLFSPPVPATMQFFTLANQPGALYVCQYVSAFYRTVRYELDKVDDLNTPLFDHYNTGSLPSGGPARNLSVISAYSEAGVEFQATSNLSLSFGAGFTQHDSGRMDSDIRSNMLPGESPALGALRR